jgi:hypothetical protein
MKQLIKSGLIKMLARRNRFLSTMTDPRDLRSLLKRLHPLSTDKGLTRLGPGTDGGYLVPNDLAGISACFSPGVSSVSGFEMDCAERGMKVFLADKSVDRPAEEHPLFHFTKKFVGATSDEDFMTLDGWVAASVTEPDSDLLLQIDVEGYEYEVFLSASDALMRRFRVIVGEFHALDELWGLQFFKLAGRAFEKILQTHSCVHIHPNNFCGSFTKDGLEIPRVMEFTFLRRDRISHSSPRRAFPHPLDVDNSKYPTLVLPPCWYGEE